MEGAIGLIASIRVRFVCGLMVDGLERMLLLDWSEKGVLGVSIHQIKCYLENKDYWVINYSKTEFIF